MTYNIPSRLTRLRQSDASRALMRETRLSADQFIAPLFIHEGCTTVQEIPSMPGQYQYPLHAIPQEIDALCALGIKAVLLFGIPNDKDACGSSGFDEQGIIAKAIRLIKGHNPNILVISDLCFCEYTAHGHCGILSDNEKTINTEETLNILAKQALTHAKAGADWVAPSGMTDGMVGVIRNALDSAGYTQVVILSYSVKYCSSLYGPFREAAQGAPQFGDRKGYQMDPANQQEALREAALDIAEGADVIMVKPALMYLDVIQLLKQRHPEIPLCAYQVSGEYSLIKTGAEKGLFDERAAVLEALTAIRRAGADMIISYFSKDIARLIKKNHI